MSFIYSLILSAVAMFGHGATPGEAHGGIFMTPCPGEAHGGIFSVKKP